MMLQNLFTGLNLLADLSVGRTSDHLQGFRPVRSLLFSKPNLDRCALKTEGNELASTAVIDFEIACLGQSGNQTFMRTNH